MHLEQQRAGERARVALRSTWSRMRWNHQTDLWKRLEQLPAGVRGVTLKAARALAELQGRRFGAVIASGQKIARKAAIGESSWWELARPELEGAGFFITGERGGGRMPGGNGRSNVYLAPDCGHEPAPPRERPPVPPAPTTAEVIADEAAAGPPPRPPLSAFMPPDPRAASPP